jgi:hypothetical protein
MVLVGGELADDRIYSREDLTEIVSAPVLTDIPPLMTALEQQQQMRRGWLQTVVLSTLVVAMAAGFASTYLFG